MTDVTGSAAGGEASLELPADAPEEFSSVADAMSYLTSLDEKRKNPPAESAPDATAEPELSKGDRKSDTDNSDPVTDPAEVTEEDEPAELPPIDPPRSWTKDEKEEFQTYPREAQEKIARREQERETNFRRSQNEIAEQRKATEAERSKAEQARQQYESKLSSTVKAMESTLQAEFGDIQTMQDVRALQANDPFRFQAWQVRQMELTTAKSEQIAAEQRQAQDKQTKRANYETEQNANLVKLVPEMANPKKAAELRESAIAMLNDDYELQNDLLSRWMQDDTGHEILSNAGIQKLIADGLKYRDIKAAPKAIAAKPLPPVQKPGTTRATSDASDREQVLSRKPELTQKEALELLGLQSGRQRRRAS